MSLHDLCLLSVCFLLRWYLRRDGRTAIGLTAAAKLLVAIPDIWSHGNCSRAWLCCGRWLLLLSLDLLFHGLSNGVYERLLRLRWSTASALRIWIGRVKRRISSLKCSLQLFIVTTLWIGPVRKVSTTVVLVGPEATKATTGAEPLSHLWIVEGILVRIALLDHGGINWLSLLSLLNSKWVHTGI